MKCPKTMMKSICRSMCSPSSAKVVDGKLILSFPNAVNPTVWQMDCDQYASSALEVTEKSSKFHLHLKTSDDTPTLIASFEERETAVHALKVVSKALGSAQGKLSKKAAPAGFNWRKWLGIAGVIFLIYIVLSFLSALSPVSPSGIAPSQSAGGSAAPVNQTGVPMSADDFLRQR